MSRRTRKCYLCGGEYKYCPTCSQDRMKPAWMAEFHEDNCKNIFDICTRFNMKLMNKEEAQEALKKCDLSNKENFKSYVQTDIKNIFAEDKSPAKAEDKPVQRKSLKLEHEVVTIENDKAL